MNSGLVSGPGNQEKVLINVFERWCGKKSKGEHYNYAFSNRTFEIPLKKYSAALCMFLIEK